MSLSTLPVVLVQTVMHALQTKEILALARSSKWTMQCAESAFAWRHCPPVCSQLERSPPSCRLLRHISLSLATAVPSVDPPGVGSVEAFVALSHRARIVEFRGEVTALCIASASLQFLRTLSVSQVDREAVRAIAQLPALTSFAFRKIPCAADLEPLLSAPVLTALEAVDTAPSLLPTISHLPHLRSLSLFGSRPTGGSLLAFCLSPVMSAQLESLSLHHWKLNEVSAAELAACFSALSALRRLEVAFCDQLQRLLAVVHLAPQLRRVCLSHWSSAVSGALFAVMTAAPMPSCDCTIWDSYLQRPAAVALAELETQFAGRFTLALMQ